MHGELPEFKRCCFCLPLRRGLVGWGYFRLALDVLAIIRFVYICVDMMLMGYLANGYYLDIIFCIGVTTYYFIDAVFAIFLIVGGHKKSYKLLRVSYIYCIVWLALILILGGFIVYNDIARLQRMEQITLYQIKNIIFGWGITFIVIFVQVYLILLTRSEQIKLRRENTGMRFVNNAADAESFCVCNDN